MKPKNKVNKNQNLSARPRTSPWVDLHFHGAWGFDFHRTDLTPELFAQFCGRLAQEAGALAFCPTTVTAPWWELLQAVDRLGQATRAQWERLGFDPKTRILKSSPKKKLHKEALSLGIHLEGPFLAAPACGAHPPQALLPMNLERLNALWEASHQTLVRLTFAPEALVPELADHPSRLIAWATQRGISLSLGHTQTTEERARFWLDLGVIGVTHSWNAMPFHHRAPGLMGAALGRKDTVIEVIGDQLHVAPTVALWVLALQGPKNTALVSDCTPATHTAPGTVHSMGPLLSVTRSLQDGASHLVDPTRPMQGGGLAGGGLFLSDQLALWYKTHSTVDWTQSVTTAPLRALGFSARAIASIVRSPSRQ